MSNQSFLDQQFSVAGDMVQDEPSLLDLVSLVPGTPADHLATARALVRAGQLEQAKEAVRQTIARAPHSPDAQALLGALYLETADPAAAMPHLVRASELLPNWAEARRLCGEAAWRLGQLDVAKSQLIRAIALRPDWPEAEVRLAEVLLRLGDYGDGWPLLESRWKSPAYGGLPRNGVPIWTGTEPLYGKSIVFLAEEGLNELLQFVRYATLLQRKGATVLVTCPSDLAMLVRSVEGVSNAIPFGLPVPAADFQIPLLSLPLAFGTMLGSIPSEIPYITAAHDLDLEFRRHLEQRSTSPGRRIGVLWRGYPGENLPAARTIPLDALAPLWAIPDINWFSLAIGEAVDDVARANAPMIDLSEVLDSADAFAAAVHQLDAVVAVDTAVTHLAGVMGKPAFVLLNAACAWRWPGISEQAPWYPSVRLFRQNVEGEWATPIGRLVRALDSTQRPH